MTSTSQSIPQLSPEFLALLHEVEEGRVRGSTALTPEEVYWRDHQVWLEQSGYMLRPRYHPTWVSSAPGGKDVAFLYEDSVRIRVSGPRYTLEHSLSLLNLLSNSVRIFLMLRGYRRARWSC